MNYPIPFTSRRNVRAFVSVIIAYFMLVGQVAPLALAANAPAARPAPEAAASQPAPVSYAPVPQPLAVAPNITATKSDNRNPGTDPAIANPGDTISYTVTITNNGMDATGVQFNDMIDANTTLVNGSTTTTPIASPDSFNVIGNVRIQVPDGATDLLGNDCDPDPVGGPCTNAGLTITTLAGDSSAPFAGTSAQGGQVTATTGDGSFQYNPAPGFAGPDTFTYTVTDGTGKTDTATVTLQVGNGTGTPGSNVIWFVNPSSPVGGDGRLTNPFNCYTGTSNGAQTCFSDTAADDIGDSIFLFSGAHTGGNTLLNNQKLVGAGASDTLVNITGFTVPTFSDALPATGGASPTITTTNVNAIPLGQGNTLRGFTVGNTGTGAKISGSSFGTLTVGNNTTPDVTLNGTGQALNLTTGTFAATSAFTSVASTSSTNGINLDGVAGTVALGSTTTISNNTAKCISVQNSTANINFGNTSCSGAAGPSDGVFLQNNSAGTRTFGTLSASGLGGNAFLHGNGAGINGGGNVTVTGAATLASTLNPIDIQNAAASTSINFQNSVSATRTGAGGVGVNVANNNASSTITFNSLSISTNAGTGLSATGGGTVNVTNATGTINSTPQAAPAIVGNGVTLNANFAAINSSGGTNGVSLTNVSGTSSFGNGTLTGASGAEFFVSGSNPAVTYGGAITQNNAARVVDIQGTTGNTITLAGTVTGGSSSTGVHIGDTTAVNGNVTFNVLNLGTSGARMTNQAVTITNGGSSATYDLGAVSIFTSGASAQGIAATSFDGALNCTGTVNTSGASAINISGPAGLTALTMTMTSVAANGGTNGIKLLNTSGSFTVNGDGASDTANTTRGRTTAKQGGGTITLGSGGTINNTTGAAISLNNAANVTLRNLSLTGNGGGVNSGADGINAQTVTTLTLDNLLVMGHLGNDGFFGSAVSALTMQHMDIHTNAKTAGVEASDIWDVRLDNLTGTCAVSNSLFFDAREDIFTITNNSTNNLTLTVTNSEFRDTDLGIAPAVGDAAFQMLASGSAVTTLTATGCTFKNVRLTGFHYTGNNTSSGTVKVMNSVFGGTTAGGDAANQNGVDIDIDHQGAGTTLNYEVSGNTTRQGFRANTSTSINIFLAGLSTVTSQMVGTVKNNAVGIAGTANSGSDLGFGIALDATGAGTLTATVTGNTVNQVRANSGNVFDAGTSQTAKLNLKIRSNTLNGNPAQVNPQYGLHINAGTGTPGETNQLCIDMGQNSVTMPASAIAGVDLDVFPGTTTQLVGYAGGADTGGGQNAAAIQSFLQTTNTVVIPPALYTPAGGMTKAAVAPCSTFVFPTGPVTFSEDTIGGPGGISTQAAPGEIPNGAPADTSEAAPAQVSAPDASASQVEQAPTLQTRPAAAATRTAPTGVRVNLKQPKTKGTGSQLRYSATDTTAPLGVEPLSAVQGKRLKPVSRPRVTSEPVTPNAPPCTNDSGHVCVIIGTLAAGDSVTITFQVTVNSPYNGGPTVSNQGSISFNESVTPVLTDDPAVGGAADPTLTSINAVNVFAGDGKAPEPAAGSAPLLFTITLSQPSPGGVSVNFTTADQSVAVGHAVGGATCDGTVDYQTTNSIATFAAGERVKTVSVPICADSTAGEPDETFLFNLTGATGATLQDNQAVGTITAANPAGTFLISELRTSGPNPNGSTNEFVELYNNTNTPLTVPAGGYGLFKMGTDCNATPVLVGTIPATTVIPARGHFLFTGAGYGLGAYAVGDLPLLSDIENDHNVAVFSTTDVTQLSTATRLDAVGFDGNTGGGVCDLLREGSTLPPVSGSTTEHSFFRKECDFQDGVGCTTAGTPKDTNDNAADFLFADTQGTFISGVIQRLGAPGPENMTSPIKRDLVAGTLLDNSKSSSAPPNRDRNPTPNTPDATVGTFGTLSIRRRFQNNTGANVTRLRFRIVEVTTSPAAPGNADVRAITSSGVTISDVNDPNTCQAANGVPTTPCSVNVKGTTLEQPPNQTIGGGYNSTLADGTITTMTPLAPGASAIVQFVLGVKSQGKFRFIIIVEALP